jgi:DNA-binding LacI/PurR family transcriptional regulator
MNHDTKMIGFDAEGLPPFNQQPKLDSVIQENSRSLGQQAIQLIRQRRLGASPPNTMLISPKLITRQNIDSDEVMAMMSGDWKLGHWHWSSTR